MKNAVTSLHTCGNAFNVKTNGATKANCDKLRMPE